MTSFSKLLVQDNEDGTITFPMHVSGPFGHHALHRTRGWRIGRLAVPIRGVIDGRYGRVWPVTHLITGQAFTFTTTFELSTQAADDISRWARFDLTGTSAEELVEQLGGDLARWMRSIHIRHFVMSEYAYESFEEWCIKRKGCRPHPPLYTYEEHTWEP